MALTMQQVTAVWAQLVRAELEAEAAAQGPQAITVAQAATEAQVLTGICHMDQAAVAEEEHRLPGEREAQAAQGAFTAEEAAALMALQLETGRKVSFASPTIHLPEKMNYHLIGQRGFLGKTLLPYCGGDLESPVWINAIAKVMGIGGNQKFPADMLTENLRSAINVFDLAVANGCKRLVNFGSTCAYSPSSASPFEPHDYLEGMPETTNYGYAVAKRTIYSMSLCYSDQYGMNNLYLVMPNLYGPGCHFGSHNHVIPDMIVKIQEAIDNGKKEILFFGTGAAEREFLYIEDAAQLVLKAIAECDSPLPVHLSGAFMLTIRSLAMTLVRLMGFEGNVRWDGNKPDGQMRRELAKGIELGDYMPFEQGLKNTISYFRLIRKSKEAVL